MHDGITGFFRNKEFMQVEMTWLKNHTKIHISSFHFCSFHTSMSFHIPKNKTIFEVFSIGYFIVHQLLFPDE